MANRFPLTINTTSSTIEELPAGDNLDLSGSNISNVGNITTTGIDSGNSSITNVVISNTANIANLVTIKYNETVNTSNVSGTISPDIATGTIFKYTLVGDITLDSLTNAVAGSSATIILIQDSTGSRTLTSTMKFLGGEKTLTTSANAIDVLSVFYDGTTYYASLGQGFA